MIFSFSIEGFSQLSDIVFSVTDVMITFNGVGITIVWIKYKSSYDSLIATTILSLNIYIIIYMPICNHKSLKFMQFTSYNQI